MVSLPIFLAWVSTWRYRESRAATPSDRRSPPPSPLKLIPGSIVSWKLTGSLYRALARALERSSRVRRPPRRPRRPPGCARHSARGARGRATRRPRSARTRVARAPRRPRRVRRRTGGSRPSRRARPRSSRREAPRLAPHRGAPGRPAPARDEAVAPARERLARAGRERVGVLAGHEVRGAAARRELAHDPALRVDELQLELSKRLDCADPRSLAHGTGGEAHAGTAHERQRA